MEIKKFLIALFLFFQFPLTEIYSQIVSVKYAELMPGTKHDFAVHDSIVNYYYGIVGNGFIGNDEWIGLCDAKYKWGGPWRPVDGYKRTLCGYAAVKKNNSKKKSVNDPSNYHLVSKGDGDIVIYLIPDPSFRWLQFQSLRPQGHYFKDFSIACEIALKEPGNTVETDGENYIQSIFLEKIQFKTAGVYGPWVSDVGHESSPEIHPIQQMWVKNELEGGTVEYLLFSMFDNSSRFNSPEKFEDTCSVKKWQELPMRNRFYLPFSISSNENERLVYDMKMPSWNNIQHSDSSHSAVKLIVDGWERIEILKPLNSFPQIKFSNISKRGENLIIGYIEIETLVGSESSQNGGHAFLQVAVKKSDE
jgi:hypothetical protein